MATTYQRGSTPTFLARITDAERSTESAVVGIDPATIESMTYTVRRKNAAYGGDSYSAVEGHTDQNIPATAILEEFIVDKNWTTDSTGYNFKFSPDSRTHAAFADIGTYEVTFTIIFLTGNPLVWTRTLVFV